MKIKPLTCWFVLFTLMLISAALFFFLTNLASKESNWQFAIKDQVGVKSVLNVGKNLTFDNQSVYFGDGKGLIHSLNKNSGAIRWLSQLPDHSPFEITQDGHGLYIAAFDSSIYKLDKKTGHIIWKYTIADFYWPDTEVIFDDNDDLVFFADRSGFLYALSRESGQEVWRQAFGTIDRSKKFVENSIHFGFITQGEDILIVDHFPSRTIFEVDKKTGHVLAEQVSKLSFNFAPQHWSYDFGFCRIEITNNIIHQPNFDCQKDGDNIWSYRPADQTIGRRQSG